MEQKSRAKHPPELKVRAVRMVTDLREQGPHDKPVISRVDLQLGVGDELLRSWVKRAEVEAGKRPGLTTAEVQELKDLRKEVKELRRANDLCRPRRDSSGRSSTAGQRSIRLHRRPSGPHNRQASRGGRADL